jgi:hypothetical protein
MTMMMNTAKRLRPGDFQVSDEDRPGWVRGSARTPRVGETVYCAGGEGTVVSVQGKTGNGSRLVQIRLAPPAAPFFAAASNVLLMPG